MLEYCRPKFRSVQVQTVDQNELNQIVHVFQAAHGFAVLERVTLQSDQMKQRNNSHPNAFDRCFNRRLIQLLKNFLGDEHQIHVRAGFILGIELQKGGCVVFDNHPEIAEQAAPWRALIAWNN